MDFFARQARAREQSQRLVALFVTCVIAVALGVAMALTTVFVGVTRGARMGAFTPGWLAAHWQLPVACVFLTVTVILIGAAVKTIQLGGGGAYVARSLGADPIATDTRDPARRRLLNVVEEMSIASGVPVPRVYLMEHERGLNAFTAGYTPADAVLAVTRGAMERFDRDELMGVVGHEFSHILNGDTRLNMQLIGMVGGLFALATLGRVMARVDSGTRRGSWLGLTGGILVALGFGGYLAGRWIQAAISRQREFLADASAVQFTRDPTGLRNALVKIGALDIGSRLESNAAADVAHMLFASGLAGPFDTHPPVVERIRALDPSFQPDEFARVAARLAAEPWPPVRPVVVETGVPPANAIIPVEPARIAALVGNPAPEHVEVARSLRADVPDELRLAMTQPRGATAVLMALTLDEEAGVRNRQLDVLRGELGEELARDAAGHYAQLSGLAPIQQLAMLQRAVPALARLPQADRERIITSIDAMIGAGGSIGISAYARGRVARVQLTDQLAPRAARDVLVIADVVRDLQTLLSTLARFGHAESAAAERAYDAGMEVMLPDAHPRYAPSEPWIAPLDQALDRLDRLTPVAKQRLVEALVTTVALDGRVTSQEAELLRTICATLHCPLPPLLAQ